MKRLLAIGLIPLALGVAGAFVRARELAFAFDPTTGLPKQTLIGTTILMIGGALLLLYALAIGFKVKAKPIPHHKSTIFTVVALVSFAVLLGLAGYQFYQNTQVKTMIGYVLAVLTLFCSISIAITGIQCLRSNDNAIYSLFTILPVFWACFSLILVFRDRIADPIIADYIFLLFGFICILLFLYTQAGYIYRKNRLMLSVVTAMLGTYFCSIEVLAPIIAAKLSETYLFVPNFSETISLAVFVIYMPFAAVQMLRNENKI